MSHSLQHLVQLSGHTIEKDFGKSLPLAQQCRKKPCLRKRSSSLVHHLLCCFGSFITFCWKFDPHSPARLFDHGTTVTKLTISQVTRTQQDVSATRHFPLDQAAGKSPCLWCLPQASKHILFPQVCACFTSTLSSFLISRRESVHGRCWLFDISPAEPEQTTLSSHWRWQISSRLCSTPIPSNI